MCLWSYQLCCVFWSSLLKRIGLRKMLDIKLARALLANNNRQQRGLGGEADDVPPNESLQGPGIRLIWTLRIQWDHLKELVSSGFWCYLLRSYSLRVGNWLSLNSGAGDKDMKGFAGREKFNNQPGFLSSCMGVCPGFPAPNSTNLSLQKLLAWELF
jgi:hypothetical protein